MQTERETKEVTSPAGHKIVLYTYATGREARQIDSKYASAMKVDLQDGQPNMKDVDLSMAYEGENEALMLLVRSLDDSSEDIVNRILDLPQDEYSFIVAEVNNVTKKKNK